MTLIHKYRDFGSEHGISTETGTAKDVKVEEVRLEAYEGGYQAGWDDATEAHGNEKERVLSDLAQRLEDMAFTYQEAHAKIMLALEPMLTQLVTRLLPQMTEKSLQAHLLAQILDLAERSAAQSVELAVSPDTVAPLEALLKDRIDLPFAINAEPSLADGQAYLRVDQSERLIDLDAVTEATTEAFEAFFDSYKDVQNHD